MGNPRMLICLRSILNFLWHVSREVCSFVNLLPNLVVNLRYCTHCFAVGDICVLSTVELA